MFSCTSYTNIAFLFLFVLESLFSCPGKVTEYVLDKSYWTLCIGRTAKKFPFSKCPVDFLSCIIACWHLPSRDNCCKSSNSKTKNSDEGVS